MNHHWPDLPPEAKKGSQPWVWIALIAFAAAVTFWAARHDSAPQQQAFQLPNITWPDFSLRDQARQTEPPVTTSSEAIEAAIPSMIPTGPDANGRSVQSVPFESCLGVINDSANTFGQPAIIEATADRHVARFKLQSNEMTVTCSRPDGTMTIESR